VVGVETDELEDVELCAVARNTPTPATMMIMTTTTTIIAVEIANLLLRIKLGNISGFIYSLSPFLSFHEYHKEKNEKIKLCPISKMLSYDSDRRRD